MSVFGAFYTKNNIAFVTDTIASLKTPFYKNGRFMAEEFASLTSKALYYPHFQTALCSMGLSILSTKLNQFIDESRCLTDMDSFIMALDSSFISFFQKDKEAMEITYPGESTTWLGAAIIIGVSTFQNSDIEKNAFTGERCLRIIKALVWKDKVRFENVNVMEENQPYGVAFTPKLPEERIQDLIVTDWSSKYNNQIEGFLVEHMKELKVNYDKSNRFDFMVGGELNMTSMFYDGSILRVTHHTAYRFDDFEDNVKEIKHANSEYL